MTQAKFYAIGVGPGDPELVTIKAARLIEASDIIVVPRSGASVNVALQIAKPYTGGKTVVEVDMPMTKNETEVELAHQKAADLIGNYLDEGKNVSFLTLGDPTVYSTSMYVLKLVASAGYKTEIIPGITSFCAAAARLQISLCEKEEMLHIVPSTYIGLDQIEHLDGTKVLLKTSKSFAKTKAELIEAKAMLVERATMTDEIVCRNLTELDTAPGYLSLVIIPAKT